VKGYFLLLVLLPVLVLEAAFAACRTFTKWIFFTTCSRLLVAAFNSADVASSSFSMKFYLTYQLLVLVQ
jgi:hypothetical protein